MKKKLFILVAAALLALVLAVPASASKPVDVSGGFGVCVPNEPVWREAGGNCMIEHYWECEWNGDLTGVTSILIYIQDHGPCSEMGPFSHEATGHAKGTFTGEVCLGSGPERECRSGSFDYVDAQHFTFSKLSTPEAVWRMAVLKGYDGLEGLHGTIVERAGVDVDSGVFFDTYTGRLHFEPK